DSLCRNRQCGSVHSPRPCVGTIREYDAGDTRATRSNDYYTRLAHPSAGQRAVERANEFSSYFSATGTAFISSGTGACTTVTGASIQAGHIITRIRFILPARRDHAYSEEA